MNKLRYHHMQVRWHAITIFAHASSARGRVQNVPLQWQMMCPAAPFSSSVGCCFVVAWHVTIIAAHFPSMYMCLFVIFFFFSFSTREHMLNWNFLRRGIGIANYIKWGQDCIRWSAGYSRGGTNEAEMFGTSEVILLLIVPEHASCALKLKSATTFTYG